MGKINYMDELSIDRVGSRQVYADVEYKRIIDTLRSAKLAISKEDLEVLKSIADKY